MKILFSLLLMTTILLVIQSCGTIIQGTTQQVGISSSPTNANVAINGVNVGSTPVMIDLKRKDSHIVRITLDGYQIYETTLTRKVSGWVWGNIVFGGLIGLVVDSSTGGMYKLTPEQIQAELRDGKVRVVDTEGGLFITFAMQAKSDWEKVGELIPETN
jgi:hypothetical protein